MLFGRKDATQLRCELDAVKAEIAALPSQTEENMRAQEIIERLKADGVSIEEINVELAQHTLPSVDQVGKNTAASLFPLWKLNRQRRKLEKRLAHLD